MTYYRLAVQDYQSARWIWKTTAVTSLQALLQLLRSYRMLSQDGIRVFSASSEAELNEMLSRQNNHLESGSVTVAQFLQARKIAGGEQSTSEERGSPQTMQQGTDTATWAGEVWDKHRAAQYGAGTVPTSRLCEYLAAPGALSSAGMDSHEKKRLEIELGPGGDHDTRYLFTLPIVLKEQLAWLHMQVQVKAGELPS